MKRLLFKNDCPAEDEQDFDRVQYFPKHFTTLKQEELTYPAFMSVVDIFKPKINLALESIKKFDFINLALERKEIERILIVLGLKPKEINSLKASEVNVIIQDFFFLNPELKKKLAALSSESAMKKMTDSLESFGRSAADFPAGFLLHGKKLSFQSRQKTLKSLKKQKP